MSYFGEQIVYPPEESNFDPEDYARYEFLEETYNMARRGLDLQPKLETPRFTGEMDSPLKVLDDQTGLEYGVYQVNCFGEGSPIVMNMSWSVAGGSKSGRNEIKAYARRTDRPITLIDTEGHGLTDPLDRKQRKSANFDDIASAHLRVIDSLGIDEFDLQGMSMGGVIAAKIAELAGERAGSLVTISTVGFQKQFLPKFGFDFAVKEGHHQARYAKAAEKVVKDEVDTGFAGEMKQIPTLLKLARLMTEDTVTDAAANLNPNTKWLDIVGSDEEVTDWRKHLKAVRDRNAELPGSSTLHLITGQTHAWSSLYLNEVAELAMARLNK